MFSSSKRFFSFIAVMGLLLSTHGMAQTRPPRAPIASQRSFNAGSSFLSSLEGRWAGPLTRLDFGAGQNPTTVDMRTIATVTRTDLRAWTVTLENTSSLGTIDTRTIRLELNDSGQVTVRDGLCLINSEVVPFEGEYILDYAGLGAEVYPRRRQVDFYQQLKLSGAGVFSGSNKTLINGEMVRQERFSLRRL